MILNTWYMSSFIPACDKASVLQCCYISLLSLQHLFLYPRHCFTETSLQLSWLTNFETGSECEKFLSLKPIISAKFKLIERNLKWSRSMNIVLVWQFVLTNEIWAKLKLKPAFSSSEYMKQCHETSPEKVSRTRCKLVALSDKFCMLTWHIKEQDRRSIDAIAVWLQWLQWTLRTLKRTLMTYNDS